MKNINRVKNHYRKHNENKYYSKTQNERTGFNSSLRKIHINDRNTMNKRVEENNINDFLGFLRRKNAMPLSKYMNKTQIK